jgi:hypothetical protein
VKYQVAYRGYFLSQLGKYLPGGIWVVPGRAIALSRSGVHPVASSTASITEAVFLLVTAIVLSLPYSFYVDLHMQSAGWLSSLAVLVMALVLLLSAMKGATFRPKLQRIGFDFSSSSLGGKQIAAVLATYVLFWLLTGVGFSLLVTSLHPVSLSSWPPLMAAFCMAWTVGFLAFLTPAGLGIREGALALFLSPLLPAPVPSVIALLARVWWTVAEGILIAVAAMWRSRAQPS